MGGTRRFHRRKKTTITWFWGAACVLRVLACFIPLPSLDICALNEGTRAWYTVCGWFPLRSKGGGAGAGALADRPRRLAPGDATLQGLQPLVCELQRAYGKKRLTYRHIHARAHTHTHTHTMNTHNEHRYMKA